ncbi:MAG: glycosyltransferase family 39 protein [Bryobacterales bacterium]|nr:glycosyltransferase family 39 protein [Bryobacterales bacterium]
MAEVSFFAAVRGCGRDALLWLALSGGCLLLFQASGAFQAEFDAYPDEASHYVTSLMVKEYVAQGAPSPPLQFALDYYYHFPKVALGHYPPFLYVVQGAWMLVFPATRASLLVLNAMLIALTGTLLCRFARTQFGFPAGAGLAVLWVCLPLTQTYGGMVMAETLLTVLVFGAALAYGRYLDRPELKHAAAFGFLAALAILTKQLALFLALAPPAAVLLARRVRLMRSLSFWLPAAIVAVAAGPWYLFAHTRLLKAPLGEMLGYPLPSTTLAGQWGYLVQSSGWVIAGLMLAGLWARVIRPCWRALPVPGMWAVSAACLLALLLFSVPAPVAASEDRHLTSVQPFVLLFAAAGVAWLSEMLGRRCFSRAKWAAAVAVAAGVAFALWTFRLPHRPYRGFSEAAALVLEDPSKENSVSLVCADASGEGAFVAAIAAGDRLSGHYVLRANKALASTGWSGIWYVPTYRTADSLFDYLESVPVRFLVVQEGPGPARHTHWRLVREMLRKYSGRWTEIGVFPRRPSPSGPAAGVRLYRLIGQEGRPPSPIKVRIARLQGETAAN